MRKIWYLSVMLLLACNAPVEKVSESFSPSQRPWAIWWWPGNAIDSAGITYNLEQMAAAGFGGASIVPIYGVEGWEDRSLELLSNDWQNMVLFTVKKAADLGLQIDMTLGSGWPYGGPWVSKAQAAKKFDPDSVQGVPTRQQVKRAAPGGKGYVVNYFDREAVKHHLSQFNGLFEKLNQNNLSIRSIYHDSYEVYGANWKGNFIEQFRDVNGYGDFQQLKKIFSKEADPGLEVDYHAMINQLLSQEFTKTLSDWCQQNGVKLRNQAHGSPGNILDLYAQAEIPETEIFGYSNFKIPDLPKDTAFEPARFGQPHPLVMKFASSAAHVAGKSLVSSESATWLGEHFRVSLAQVKPQIDELFTGGINHIFYHGMPYSPPQEQFPGWLFYASTHFGPTAHFWEYLPELNRYIARNQSILQQSKPKNDLLVYFPIYDMWKKPGPRSNLHMLEVHHPENWLFPTAFGELTQMLKEEGYTFDYISDQQLLHVETIENGIKTSGGAEYKIIVVPATEVMPQDTRESLIRLQNQGAKIIYIDQLPQKYPDPTSPDLLEYSPAKEQGQVVSTSELTAELTNFKVASLPFPELGLEFIRKQQGDSLIYFLSNLQGTSKLHKFSLPDMNGIAVFYNPLTQDKFRLESEDEGYQLYLPPGAAGFLIHHPKLVEEIDAEAYREASSAPIEIEGPWSFKFDQGVPEISETYELDELQPWGSLSDSAAIFDGIGVYETDFDLPEVNEAGYLLKFDQVHEAVEVIINGENLGWCWSFPLQVKIPSDLLKKTGNQLKLRAKNLSANRIAEMDRQGIEWKKFKEINFVNIRYQPFNASHWPVLPSGLMGEVRLVPLERMD